LLLLENLLADTQGRAVLAPRADALEASQTEARLSSRPAATELASSLSWSPMSNTFSAVSCARCFPRVDLSAKRLRVRTKPIIKPADLLVCFRARILAVKVRIDRFP